MTASQQINSINDNNYDDDIKITAVPEKHFAAVTGNTLSSGSSIREVTIDIMPLEQHPGGTLAVNTGLFVKGSNETSIKVTVQQDGKVLAENTTSY